MFCPYQKSLIAFSQLSMKKVHPDHLVEELPGGDESKDDKPRPSGKTICSRPFADWICLVLVLVCETNLPGVDTKRYDSRYHTSRSKEAGAIEGTRSHYCYAAISTVRYLQCVCQMRV